VLRKGREIASIARSCFRWSRFALALLVQVFALSYTPKRWIEGRADATVAGTDGGNRLGDPATDVAIL
jgi:hypothetical protein